jgi:hypothetical protein
MRLFFLTIPKPLRQHPFRYMRKDLGKKLPDPQIIQSHKLEHRWR